MNVAVSVRYACVRCGFSQLADRMIFSSHTRLRYCRDFKACDRRYAKAARA